MSIHSVPGVGGQAQKRMVKPDGGTPSPKKLPPKMQVSGLPIPPPPDIEKKRKAEQKVVDDIQDILKFAKTPHHHSAVMEIYEHLFALQKKHRKSKRIQEHVEEAILFFDATKMRGHSF